MRRALDAGLDKLRIRSSALRWHGVPSGSVLGETGEISSFQHGFGALWMCAGWVDELSPNEVLT